jgi:hypothetical protein
MGEKNILFDGHILIRECAYDEGCSFITVTCVSQSKLSTSTCGSSCTVSTPDS